MFPAYIRMILGSSTIVAAAAVLASLLLQCAIIRIIVLVICTSVKQHVLSTFIIIHIIHIVNIYQHLSTYINIYQHLSTFSDEIPIHVIHTVEDSSSCGVFPVEPTSPLQTTVSERAPGELLGCVRRVRRLTVVLTITNNHMKTNTIVCMSTHIYIYIMYIYI